METPGSSFNGKSKKARIFLKFFCEFAGEVGDVVAFRNVTKNKKPWKIKHIEVDPGKVKWSKGGKTPNFIQLVRQGDRPGQVDTVWTCSNQLVKVGVK